MRKENLILIVVSLSLLMTNFACAPAGPVTGTPESKATAVPVKPVWQQDWEKTLAEAKKEGKLIILSVFGADARTGIASAFKDKYGLDVEFVTGSGSALLTKIETERRAGLYLADLHMSGKASLSLFRDAGLLDPVEPLLILPEVVEPKVWRGGNVNYMDKQKLILLYLIGAVAAIVVNTDLVKEGEITSYADLLNPKWKGKMVIMDPSISGAGTQFFVNVWEIMGLDFARELGKQELTITRDPRIQMEWLARGKYAISGTPLADIQAQFMKLGAPIKTIIPKEGAFVTVSLGALSLMNRAPHPNAARVFTNWLLTQEGQTLMSKLTGEGARRLDVSNEWTLPEKRMYQGVNYLDADTEEMLVKMQQTLTLSKEVWQIK